MTKWVTKKLGDGLVKSICTGKLDANAMVDGGSYRFYTCAKNYTYIDDYAFDDEALLISGNGEYVGYVHYYKGKFNAYQRTYVLRNFSIDIFYLQCYLNYYLRDRIKREMNAGSIPFIKMGTLTEMPISFPESLAEQRRIAAILSSADKVIATSEALIEKYKHIKQGMLTDLLQPKEGWKKVKLGECCEPSSEKYNPLTEQAFQYCIEMENINQESGTLNGKSDITKLLSLKTKFHKGDVLYGKLRPYLKKYWLADFDGACSTEIWVLKNFENVDNQFLFYLFQTEFINRIANLSSGTKMPRADWNFMKTQDTYIPFKNSIPDLSEQRRIASILSSIDAKILAEEKVVEKYKGVKKGLMERMMKGMGNN